MTERGFFSVDASAQGGAYSPDQLRMLLQALAGGDDGVFTGELNEYEVSINGSDLRTASGRGLVNGFLTQSDANVDKTPAVPVVDTTGLRIVLQKIWNTATDVEAHVELLEATDGTAAPPAVTQTDGTKWEISLATAEITTGGTIQTLVDTRDMIDTGNTGGWQHIDTQVLTGTASSVSFPNLDSAFKVFRLTAYITPTAALSVYLRINNVTGSNYHFQETHASSTTLAATRVTAQGQWDLTDFIDANTGEEALITAIIAGAVGTQRPRLDARAVLDDSSPVTIWTGGAHNGETTISRIDLIASTSTFAADSRFVLEGNRSA